MDLWDIGSWNDLQVFYKVASSLILSGGVRKDEQTEAEPSHVCQALMPYHKAATNPSVNYKSGKTLYFRRPGFYPSFSKPPNA